MLARLSVVVLFALWAASHSSADDASEPLSIVTYNIRYASPGDGPDVWPNRVDSVADFIAAHDIAGLQEATFSQLGDLKNRLSKFDSYGVGRDDGKDAGEQAVIFFRRDRFAAIDRGTFWLSEDPARVGVKGWDAAFPRTCTWMVLSDKMTDQRLWIANTHFDHRGTKARAESGALIRRVVGQRAGRLPVIVMGDFNCVPESDPYNALTAAHDPPSGSAALVDARHVSKTPPQGPNSTWNGFREVVADRIIDHIFVRGPMEVMAFETLDPKTPSGRFASDHLPVRVSVRLTGDGGDSPVDDAPVDDAGQ